MNRKIISLLIVLVVLFSFVPTAFAGAVTITDSNFRSALYQLTGLPTSEQLTTEALAGITGDVNLSGRGISNIDGIEYLTGASSIDLSLNDISSVPREIEQLDSLLSLDISGNRLTRIPSNVGGMDSLKELDISANRLDEIPSNLTKLSLTTFKCDYNFLDVSDGSSARSTINLISAQNKYYQDQLVPVNLSAYSPSSGTIVLYWSEMEHMQFDNGAIGEIARFSVLDSGYNYLGETSALGTTYEISGLDTTTEYTFYVSADYYVKGTKYSSSYTKLYKSIKLKAVPMNTPMPEPSATETPTPTPVPQTPTPEPATATPTPVVETATTVPTNTPIPENEGNTGGGNAIYIIIIVLAVIFVGLLIIIVLRAAAQRSNRNSRYRR